MSMTKAVTLWLAGPYNQAHKVFATEIGARLRQRCIAVELLNGDADPRMKTLNSTPDIDCIQGMCSSLNRRGVVTVVSESTLSDLYRRSVVQRLNAVVVHVNVSAAEEVEEFEAPVNPALVYQPGQQSLADTVNALLRYLEDQRQIPTNGMEFDDELRLTRRLIDLGYL
jgi:adenylylsulfate kinase-like enzyme